VPLELAPLIAPGHTALVTVEVQEGVVGERSLLPALRAAAQNGMIDNIAALARAARAVGVPVVHCTAETRADGLGANDNCRLFAAMRKGPATLVPGSPLVQVVAGVGVEDGDFVLPRLHGVSPMTGTEVDPILRNMGVTTIVGTGVSVNIALLGLAIEAVNLGYQVVLPADATAGVDATYVEAVYENTLSLLATVTSTRAVLDAWGYNVRA
jgi:nicotinamidase-related amidase